MTIDQAVKLYYHGGKKIDHLLVSLQQIFHNFSLWCGLVYFIWPRRQAEENNSLQNNSRKTQAM